MTDARRSGPEPVRLPQLPRHLRAFQLSEVLEPGGEAEAKALYWNGSSFTVLDSVTFTVTDKTGFFWGALQDRGEARLVHAGGDTPLWLPVANPGRPWYWATLDADLAAGGTAAATLRDGPGGAYASLGSLTVSGKLLTAGQLDAGELVRASCIPYPSTSDHAWEVIGATCE